jgi:REP element-mobilizing transposase RayT
MPNTFSQIYIHLVFAVKFRQSLINVSWEIELYKYINGIIKNKGQIPIIINGMPDHIHILFIMKPTCCISDLVREIKKSSTEFIKEKGFLPYKFQWQEGYGAFSYSQSSLNNVIKYIENQKQHHAIKTFKNEYQEFLNMFEIDFNQDYLFDWILEK